MSTSISAPARDRMDELALGAAWESHTRYPHIDRAIYSFYDETYGRVVVVANNHPYQGGAAIRDAELTRIRGRLDQLGVTELAYRTFPTSGPNVGYSYALLLKAASKARQREIMRIIDEEAHRTLLEAFAE